MIARLEYGFLTSCVLRGNKFESSAIPRMRYSFCLMRFSLLVTFEKVFSKENQHHPEDIFNISSITKMITEFQTDITLFF